MLCVTLRFCEQEEEVRPSQNGGGMGRREHDDNSHLGEGIVSVARPMVGAVGKQTGRGVLPVGCFGVRKEGGREPRRGGVGRLPFEERRDEAGERWG
jgi:hypothetical protein